MENRSTRFELWNIGMNECQTNGIRFFLARILFQGSVDKFYVGEAERNRALIVRTMHDVHVRTVFYLFTAILQLSKYLSEEHSPPPSKTPLSLLCLYPDILWFEKCFFGPEILQKNWNFCFATLTYRVWKCTGFTIRNTYVTFLVTDKELRKWTNYEKLLNNRWRYLEDDRWFTLQNYNYSKMQIIACNGRWKYFYWRERIYRNGCGQSNDESR